MCPKDQFGNKCSKIAAVWSYLWPYGLQIIKNTRYLSGLANNLLGAYAGCVLNWYSGVVKDTRLVIKAELSAVTSLLTSNDAHRKVAERRLSKRWSHSNLRLLEQSEG